MTHQKPAIVRHLGCCHLTIRLEYPAALGMSAKYMRELYAVMDRATLQHSCPCDDEPVDLAPLPRAVQREKWMHDLRQKHAQAQATQQPTQQPDDAATAEDSAHGL